MKKYTFICGYCGKTFASIDYEEVKKLGKEHLKQAHMDRVMEFMNRFKGERSREAKAIKNPVNWATGWLVAMMIKEVEAS